MVPYFPTFNCNLLLTTRFVLLAIRTWTALSTRVQLDIVIIVNSIIITMIFELSPGHIVGGAPPLLTQREEPQETDALLLAVADTNEN